MKLKGRGAFFNTVLLALQSKSGQTCISLTKRTPIAHTTKVWKLIGYLHVEESIEAIPTGEQST